MKRQFILRSTLVAFSVAAVAIFATVGVRQTNYAPQWLNLPLEAPSASGELVILTLLGPTTTQDIAVTRKLQDETQTGFEHDLATLFAKEVGLIPKFVVMPSHQKLLAALQEGRGHLAAAALVPTVDLRARFTFTPSYKLVQQQLIYAVANPKPKSLREATGKRIAVIAESPAHDLLREMTGEFPAIAIDAIAEESHPDDLLKRIEKNLSDFLRADSTRLAEEAAKERLNFDRYVREGDTYLTSFDYDLALPRYQKADSLFKRFPNDADLKGKVQGLRKKMEALRQAKSYQHKDQK